MTGEKNRGWLVMLAMCLMLAMISVDFTAVNLALAPIARDLHAKMSSVQWVIDSFIISGAILLIIAGRFSDMFGKRRFFILGATIFTLASIIAGFSINIDLLIFSRTLQGIGFSIVFPVTMVLAFSAFPEDKRGLAIGITGAVSGLAQAIGPTFGGFIMEILNWRWIFFFNIPIGILSILLTLIACPKDIINQTKKRIDFMGAILLAFGLLTVIYALNEANNLGITSISFWLLIIFGALLLGLFIKLELRLDHPLIELHLFSSKSFLSLNIIRGLFGYIFFSFVFIIGLYFQNILGYDAIHAGLLLLCMTIAYAALSPFSGKWIDKIGVKIPLIVGILSSTAGFIILANVNPITSWQYFILPLVLIGISVGIILSCATVAALKSVPHDKAGTASGILYTNASIGGAIGIASTGLLIDSISVIYLKKLLLVANINVTDSQFGFLTHIVNGTSSVNTLSNYFAPEKANQLLELTQASFVQGFTLAMWVCVVLTLGAAALTFFVKTLKVEPQKFDNYIIYNKQEE